MVSHLTYICSNFTSPEKRKKKNEGSGLSQTNHEIKQLGGVNGIAIGLDSNLTVSFKIVIRREESRELQRTSKSALKSKFF